MELELHFRVLFIFSDSNQDSSSSAAFRSANSLESLDFVTNSIQQARANSLSSTASSLKYFNGLNSQCNVSASQCDQHLTFKFFILFYYLWWFFGLQLDIPVASFSVHYLKLNFGHTDTWIMLTVLRSIYHYTWVSSNHHASI